jgi:hypothetical protein
VNLQLASINSVNGIAVIASSSAFHTTSQRPACVALYDPHSQPLEAPVQLSGLPRVFVHALAFSSTPSHANAAEFSSTPSHAAAAAHALCSFHHSTRVWQLSDIENIKTNAPQPVHVGVIDFCQKAHLGGVKGYSSGRKSSSLYAPPSYAESGGPDIWTFKCRSLFACDVALIPASGALSKRSVSLWIRLAISVRNVLKSLKML